MKELVPVPGATLRELAELAERGGIRIIAQAGPAPLLERLAYTETLREARNRVRRSNLPAMSRLLYYEQSFIAEDRGDFRADHQNADIARASGMSARSIGRHQQNLVAAGLVHVRDDGGRR